MAWFGAPLPAVGALRVDADVDALVALATRDGELVHENGTGSPAATVVVTIPYDTLIGAAETPVDLKGYGPITAAVARALATAPGSIWRRLLVEPATGRAVKTDPTTYRPTTELTRHVIARDTTCRFPGCVRAAGRCDLDHVVPFNHHNPQAGGLTTPDNLIALCRRHHLLKHRTNWQVRHDAAAGTVHWTAPTGHQYTAAV